MNLRLIKSRVKYGT